MQRGKNQALYKSVKKNVSVHRLMALATRRIKSVKQTKILKLSQNEKEMNVAKCSKNGFCCSCDSRIYNDDGALRSLHCKLKRMVKSAKKTQADADWWHVKLLKIVQSQAY